VGIKLEWEGKGISERGMVKDIQPSALLKKYDRREQLRELHLGQTLVAIDPRYFRPTEVDTLLGDPSKAQKKLGWKREISFDQMVQEMIEHDLKRICHSGQFRSQHVTNQVQSSKVHGSRLERDEHRANSEMSTSRQEGRVLLFVDLSPI
jgi:hypothetical protein